MEKNQHNSKSETSGQQNDGSFLGNQPGQQPPAENSPIGENKSLGSDKQEQHSESSFPQQEGETLGTP